MNEERLFCYANVMKIQQLLYENGFLTNGHNYGRTFSFLSDLPTNKIRLVNDRPKSRTFLLIQLTSWCKAAVYVKRNGLPTFILYSKTSHLNVYCEQKELWRKCVFSNIKLNQVTWWHGHYCHDDGLELYFSYPDRTSFHLSFIFRMFLCRSMAFVEVFQLSGFNGKSYLDDW